MTYKATEKRIVGFTDGLDEMRQTILHMLSIERYDYFIYPDSYGVEFRQYIGRDFDYLKATISRTLNDALKQDERVEYAEVISVTPQGNKALINFQVYTKIGTIGEINTYVYI